MSETKDKILVEIGSEPAMVRWARREVEIVMQRIAQRDPNNSYDRKCYDAALAAFEVLCKQGHTGSSIAETFKILTRLCHGQPLCFIKDEDFSQAGTYIKDCNREINGPIIGKTSYQCPRMASLFKDIWDDGVVTYHDNNRLVCINSENINDTFYWGFAARFIDQMFPVTLPYMPVPGKPYHVYVTTFAVDGMDVCSIDQVVEPSGDIVKINRYFKYVDDEELGGKYVEITQDEYKELKTNRDVSVESMYASFVINDLIEYQDELKDSYSLLEYKEIWDGHNNEAYNKYNLRRIWWTLMHEFKDSEEIGEIFELIKFDCGVFVDYPTAGWDIVSTLCSSVRKDVIDFVDKHPEFYNLAGTIQKARTMIIDLIAKYIGQMDEFGNKVMAITGETPEQTTELRVEAIKEIINQLEPNPTHIDEEQFDECEDCGCSCGCC